MTFREPFAVCKDILEGNCNTLTANQYCSYVSTLCPERIKEVEGLILYSRMTQIIGATKRKESDMTERLN